MSVVLVFVSMNQIIALQTVPSDCQAAKPSEESDATKDTPG